MTTLPATNDWREGSDALRALLAAVEASLRPQRKQENQDRADSQPRDAINSNNLNQMPTNEHDRYAYGGTDSSVVCSDKQRIKKNQTIQQQIKADQNALCQLLNLKPASMIDSPRTQRSPSDAAPFNHIPSNKRTTSPSSIHKLLAGPVSFKGGKNYYNSTLEQNRQRDTKCSINNTEPNQNVLEKLNSMFKVQKECNSACNKEVHSSRSKKQAITKQNMEPPATEIGETTNLNKNHTSTLKSTNPSSSSILTAPSKEKTKMDKILAKFVDEAYNPGAENSHVKLRNLESWVDEDQGPMDDSCYHELVGRGWNVDDMFKYNEKMHKITTSYNEKTLSDNYTTPLPKTKSKATTRLATQLAKEIEERVTAEGRITPESSDDDDLFEIESRRRGTKLLERSGAPFNSKHHPTRTSNVMSKSQILPPKNRSARPLRDPQTVESQSAPKLITSVPKNITAEPVRSSRRNILRSCLTSGSVFDSGSANRINHRPALRLQSAS